MCIWKVAAVDRHCDMCLYSGGCERDIIPRDFTEDSERILTAMSPQFSREKILSRSRDREVVWARYIIMNELRSLGYTLTTIGDFLGMDHATVVYGIRMVGRMLSAPLSYAVEYDIWEKFQNQYSAL